MSSIDCHPPASNKLVNSLVIATGVALGLPLALAGGWLAYSAFAIDHRWPLFPALDAELSSLSSESAGALNVYVDRSVHGRPLLLIHSVNAAASAYEMQPLFEHYRVQRPVYALDLPGYGFSERTDLARTPEAYAGAIVDVIAQLIGEPADVIALSLGGEFAARAALQRPDIALNEEWALCFKDDKISKALAAPMPGKTPYARVYADKSPEGKVIEIWKRTRRP